MMHMRRYLLTDSRDGGDKTFFFFHYHGTDRDKVGSEPCWQNNSSAIIFFNSDAPR